MHRRVRCTGGYGAPAVWCTGGTVHRRYGAPAVRCTGGMVHRRYGAPAVWCPGGTVHRRYGAPAVWCPGGTVHRRYGAPTVRCTGRAVRPVRIAVWYGLLRWTIITVHLLLVGMQQLWYTVAHRTIL